MDLYDKNELATPNLKYANSSSNYYVIMMVQNLKSTTKNSKISNIFAFPRDKMPTLSKQQPPSGCCLCKTRREKT